MKRRASGYTAAVSGRSPDKLRVIVEEIERAGVCDVGLRHTSRERPR